MGALILAGEDPWLTLAIATFGNTAGAVVNWWLGRYFIRYQNARWFPVNTDQLALAQQRFAHFGTWSLLFAWLPLIGDPLTFVAGILRVPLGPFIALTGTGKCARYAVVILLLNM